MSRPVRNAAFALAAATALTVAGIAPAAADECVRGSQVLSSDVVYFAVDSTAMSAEEKAELHELAAQYKGNPNLMVCAIGQADKSGNAAYNEDLALRRAEAVAAVLKEAGLGSADYQIKSRGEVFADDGFIKEVFGNDGVFDSDRRVEVLLMNE